MKARGFSLNGAFDLQKLSFVPWAAELESLNLGTQGPGGQGLGLGLIVEVCVRDLEFHCKVKHVAD